MNKEQLLGKESKGYRILHTADWHLGKELNGKSCQEEHRRFLGWLVKKVQDSHADALVVSGDIFDHKAVSNASRKDYVDLIDRLCELKGVEIFLIAGNQDSADFLDVDRDLYAKRLNIHVLGHPEKAEQSHFTLKGKDGEHGVKLVAIPFVDKRISLEYREDNDAQSSDEHYGLALKEYFRQAVECAKQDNPQGYPLVMAAHQAIGAKGKYDPQEYVGNLQQVSTDMFPTELAYVALGHIHQPYFVDEDGERRIRYSGSIMPMSIDDKSSEKSVMLVELRDDGHHAYEEIPITPALLNVYQLTGTSEDMLESARQLANTMNVRTLCQFRYSAPQKILNFYDQLHDILRYNDKVELISVTYIGETTETEKGTTPLATQPVLPQLDVEHPEKLVKELLDLGEMDETLKDSMMKVLLDPILRIAREQQDKLIQKEEDARNLNRNNQNAALLSQRQKDLAQTEKKLKNNREDLITARTKLSKAEVKDSELKEKAEKQRRRQGDEAYAQWCQKNKVSETAEKVSVLRKEVAELEKAIAEDEEKLRLYQAQQTELGKTTEASSEVSPSLA